MGVLRVEICASCPHLFFVCPAGEGRSIGWPCLQSTPVLAHTPANPIWRATIKPLTVLSLGACFFSIEVCGGGSGTEVRLGYPVHTHIHAELLLLFH